MSTNAIEAEQLSKRYRLGQDHRRRSAREAIGAAFRRGGSARSGRQESLVPPGRRPRDPLKAMPLGVVGRNGAGKSTLLKILSRITEPTSGVARTRGRVAALLGGRDGVPSRADRARERLPERCDPWDDRARYHEAFDEIVGFAGVERFIDTPVKRYSTGMYLRLAFAVAAHLEPDILLVDEVLAVGDAEFQARCLQRMETVEREGRTVVFVSHNLDAVNRLCRRAVWFERGSVAAEGRNDEVLDAYIRAQSRGHEDGWSTISAGPVTVHALDVTDRNGRGVQTFRRDEPVVLTVQYTLAAAVGGIDIAAFVQRVNGPEVLCESWGDSQQERPGHEGTYQARLEIPGVLNVGEYVVGLWIGDPYETYVHEMTLRSFHVTGDAHNRPNRAVALGLPWRVERIDADAPA